MDDKMPRIGNLRKYINVELLENYYRSCIHKSESGRECVSVALAEKIMILEIYKTLCTGINNNIDQ